MIQFKLDLKKKGVYQQRISEPVSSLLEEGSIAVCAIGDTLLVTDRTLPFVGVSLGLRTLGLEERLKMVKMLKSTLSRKVGECYPE